MMAISRDGLVFPLFSEIHPVWRVPVKGSYAGNTLICLITFFFDLGELTRLQSLVNLLTFSIVCAGSISLRFRAAGDGRMGTDGEISLP